MIQFSNLPWKVDLVYSCVEDCSGGNFIEVHALHLTDEERATILRAISMLPQIMELLVRMKESEMFYIDKTDVNESGIPFFSLSPGVQIMADLLNSIVAYIAPIEHSAEVVTGRWLHAVNTNNGTPEAEAALRQLTLSLSDTLNGDMSHYPLSVQDAFSNAMSLLSLAKHMPKHNVTDRQFATTDIKDGDSSDVDVSPLFTTPQVHTVSPADYANHPAVTDHYRNQNGV